MKRYEIIDHVADVGILAHGKTLEELFENAAFGMFEIFADLSNVEDKTALQIELEAENLEELFIAWLRQLHYLHETKHLIFRSFSVAFPGDFTLKGRVSGESYDGTKHYIKTEVKSVTYHGVMVEKRKGHWSGKVLFDL